MDEKVIQTPTESAKEKIASYLAEQRNSSTPLAIAIGTGLNKNSVRRELQAMFEKGLVKRDEDHAYSLASAETVPQTEAQVASPTSSKDAAKTFLNKTEDKVQPARREQVMPGLTIKIPKIKVDEVLFFTYTTPAAMTKTASLGERETVIYRVLPEDLMDKLMELDSSFETLVSKHLKTIFKGKLYFIKYPIEKHKPSLMALVDEWNKKYADFADEVFQRRAELEQATQAFYGRHKITRNMLPLTQEELRERFKVNALPPVPFSLRGGLVSDVVSNDELQRIKAQIRDQVDKAYRDDMNTRLDEFFSSITGYVQRMNEGKMVRGNSVSRLRRLYNEALEGLSITQDQRYEGAFDVMGKLIGELSSRHEQHQSAKGNKDIAAGIIAATITATKEITSKAQPVLEEFETILAAEKQPVKKREGIREVIEGLKLPDVSSNE